MSGTSMACPIVSGLAARSLAANQGLLTANRDQQRTKAILGIVTQRTRKLGFPFQYEGAGLAI